MIKFQFTQGINKILKNVVTGEVFQFVGQPKIYVLERYKDGMSVMKQIKEDLTIGDSLESPINESAQVVSYGNIRPVIAYLNEIYNF